ncbi:unnamed protein product [Mytilus edulis]|uniref:B box-type domain-containing protein n=1 Tax=Mytilus edulis TaxID=6550 RepID=A0A8S3QMX9_MYTED|nr:unnamed protein product [Mytilus edulis]
MASKLCNPCGVSDKDVEAVNICIECNENLCLECSNHHRSLKATKSHQLLDVSLEKPTSILIRDHCEIHPSQEYQYFCSEHAGLCCRECLAEAHWTCEKVMTIDAAAKNVKQSEAFLKCEEEIHHIHESYLEILQRKRENENEVKVKVTDIKEKVKTMKSDLIGKVTRLETATLSCIASTAHEIFEKLDIEKDSICAGAKEAQDYLSEIDFMKKHGTDKQIFLLCNTFSHYTQRSNEQIPNLSARMNYFSISFDEFPALLSSTESFGTISIEDSPAICSFDAYKDCQAPVTATAQYRIDSFQFRNKFDIKGNEINGIAVTDDKKVICYQHNYIEANKALLYSFDGKYLGNIKLKGDPQDIAILPASDLAIVTLQNKKKYALQKINTKTMKTEHLIQVTYPVYGIDAKNNDIIVGSGDEVKYIDDEGLVVRSVDGKGTSPTFVKFGSNEDIYYITDSSLYCMNKEEVIKMIYICDQFLRHSFTLDKYGIIYFFLENSKGLYQLDLKDEFPDMLTVIPEVEISKPCFMCFDNSSSKLFLSDVTYGVAIYNCCSTIH